MGPDGHSPPPEQEPEPAADPCGPRAPVKCCFYNLTPVAVVKKSWRSEFRIDHNCAGTAEDLVDAFCDASKEAYGNSPPTAHDRVEACFKIFFLKC